MPWRARPRSSVRASPGLASRSTLLTIAPATLTPLPLEQRRVEDDLVDRAPDAALRDDDGGRAEHPGDGRVRQPDDRPDAGVTGAFDEQDVAFGGEGRVGGADPGRQVLDDLALDVGLGEAPRDVDRAHLLERLAQAEDLLHEHGILVGGHAVLDDRPLADRLQEGRRQPAPLEPVEDAEADRGLAAVLPGRGEIDMSHAPPGPRSAPPLGRRSGVAGGLALDEGDRVAQAGERLGLDGVGLEERPEALHDVRDRLRKTDASATKNCGSLL